jgi:hypothetical protein
MSDFIGFLMEMILMAKWPRRLILGGILAVIIGMGGLASREGWIGIAVIGGLLLFLEVIDVFVASKRKPGRDDRGCP